MAAATGRRSAGYRFLLGPRWIALTVVVVVGVVAMLGAARWQWNRHHEVGERNEQLVERTALAPVGLAELGIAGGGAAGGGVTAGVDPADLTYRRVRLRGSFRPDEQVLVRQRSRDGQPGVWALAPFVTDGSQVIAVGRGWLPAADGANVDAPLITGEGSDLDGQQLELLGWVLPGQERGSLGPIDPGEGRLDSLARVDLGRLDAQSSGELAPVWVQLETSDPRDVSTGFPVPLPTPDRGNHLSYTGQWLIFSGLAMLGWFVVVRRQQRRLSRPAAPAGEPLAGSSIGEPRR